MHKIMRGSIWNNKNANFGHEETDISTILNYEGEEWPIQPKVYKIKQIESPEINGEIERDPSMGEPANTCVSTSHSTDCSIFELHQERISGSRTQRSGVFGWFKSVNRSVRNKRGIFSKFGCTRDEATCDGCLSKCQMFPGKLNLSVFQLGPTVGTGSYATVCLAKYKENKHYPPFTLKILHKSRIITEKQVKHVKNERDILASVRHPFIVHYYNCFQDDVNIYMVLEYLCGGELFSYIHKYGVLNPEYAQFYAAEITLAIDYLHAKNVIYRDLKPENVLLDRYGHIRLVDFGFSKVLKNKTYTLCGTHEYLAPEIFLGKGHKHEVDWWSFGILLYEILVGRPPFHSDSPTETYDLALENKIVFPPNITEDAKDLIRSLLVVNPTKRLGSKNPSAIYSHDFFTNINWTDALSKNVLPPIVPDVADDYDTKNYYTYPETWEAYSIPITIAQQNEYFNNF